MLWLASVYITICIFSKLAAVWVDAIIKQDMADLQTQLNKRK